MIRYIKAKNFMGYESLDLDLTGLSSVEIVGRNGSGKSALLEMIVYALYGVARIDLKDVSRKQGDGSHEVIIGLDGVGTRSDILEITRGRNEKGIGYASATHGGSPVADGATELGVYVEETLGMDSVMYLSSVFFGLSDEKKGDKMINVTPAIRLENHQILANIGMYRPWKKQVDEDSKKVEKEYDVVSGNVDAYETAIAEVDVDAVKKEIAENKAEGEDIQAKIDSYDLNSLRVKMERVKAIHDNINDLKEDITKDEKTLKRHVESLEEQKYIIEECLSNIKDGNKKLLSLRKELEDLGDRDLFESEKGEITRAIAVIENDIELRNVAVHANHDSHDCPLCNNAVPDEIIKKWTGEISALTDERKAHKAQLEKVNSTLNLFSFTEKAIRKKEDDLDDFRSEKEMAEATIKRIEVDRKDAENKLRDKKTKLKSQESKFDEKAYQEIYDEIKRMEAEISELNDEKTEKTENIAKLQERLANRKNNEEKLSKAKKQLKGLKYTLKLHKIISKAFSKQGIPMELLRWFNAELEKVASSVYKNFGNGFIKIEEVPGKQPGLLYYLIDASGKRVLNSLSKGQKMMVFVSLRVALTQLMQKVSGVYVDYLVLDEIVANLDEENRNTLMSLVTGVLGKFYKQILVVSHSSIQDIFDKTITIEMGTDGISRVANSA